MSLPEAVPERRAIHKLNAIFSYRKLRVNVNICCWTVLSAQGLNKVVLSAQGLNKVVLSAQGLNKVVLSAQGLNKVVRSMQA